MTADFVYLMGMDKEGFLHVAGSFPMPADAAGLEAQMRQWKTSVDVAHYRDEPTGLWLRWSEAALAGDLTAPQFVEQRVTMSEVGACCGAPAAELPTGYTGLYWLCYEPSARLSVPQRSSMRRPAEHLSQQQTRKKQMVRYG